MNATPVRLAALAAAALIPATANAATTVGSSFDTSRGAPTAIACNGCTIAMSTVDWFPVMTDPGIVTSFRAELAAGTTAKLRVFRRDDGSTLTPIGTSATVTGTGQREKCLELPSSPDGLAIHSCYANLRKMLPQQFLYSLGAGAERL